MRSKRLEALAATFVVSAKASNNLDEVMEQIIAFGFYGGLWAETGIKLAKKNHSTTMP